MKSIAKLFQKIKKAFGSRKVGIAKSVDCIESDEQAGYGIPSDSHRVEQVATTIPLLDRHINERTPDEAKYSQKLLLILSVDVIQRKYKPIYLLKVRCCGERDGCWKIEKTYKEFAAFHRSLKRKYPQCKLPILPVSYRSQQNVEEGGRKMITDCFQNYFNSLRYLTVENIRSSIHDDIDEFLGMNNQSK